MTWHTYQSVYSVFINVWLFSKMLNFVDFLHKKKAFALRSILKAYYINMSRVNFEKFESTQKVSYLWTDVHIIFSAAPVNLRNVPLFLCLRNSVCPYAQCMVVSLMVVFFCLCLFWSGCPWHIANARKTPWCFHLVAYGCLKTRFTDKYSQTVFHLLSQVPVYTLINCYIVL